MGFALLFPKTSQTNLGNWGFHTKYIANNKMIIITLILNHKPFYILTKLITN